MNFHQQVCMTPFDPKGMTQLTDIRRVLIALHIVPRIKPRATWKVGS